MKAMIYVIFLLLAVNSALGLYYYTVLHNMIQGLYHFEDK